MEKNGSPVKCCKNSINFCQLARYLSLSGKDSMLIVLLLGNSIISVAETFEEQRMEHIDAKHHAMKS